MPLPVSAGPALLVLDSPASLESSASSSLPATAGRRKVSTRPLDRPTDSSGFVGCSAAVKTSAVSGRVQRFSSILSVERRQWRGTQPKRRFSIRRREQYSCEPHTQTWLTLSIEMGRMAKFPRAASLGSVETNFGVDKISNRPAFSPATAAEGWLGRTRHRTAWSYPASGRHATEGRQ